MVKKWLDLTEDNETVYGAFKKCNEVINDYKYNYIMCSISGGYDSDIMLDMIEKVDNDKKVHYVFFDTGIEYQATYTHLNHLEEIYHINISRIKAPVPIPYVVKHNGQPFWSKFVSGQISVLQEHNFEFKDLPYEVLIKNYPCMSAIKWWCNYYADGIARTQFNINYIKGLKEFLMLHPPKFKISAVCCDLVKKEPSHNYIYDKGVDLLCTGVRKYEGGIRSTVYDGCFTLGTSGIDYFRPVFWFDFTDKYYYKKKFDVRLSDCYEIWAFQRTGCAGCPFNKNFVQELKQVKEYEPKLYNAITNIFGLSYQYTKEFLAFRKDNKFSM